VELIERRVRDGSILRLIGKWINVRVLEDGRLLITQTGVGQGQVISPLLANIYLHYVLDEWFEDVVKPRLRGQAYEIRYSDDFILCFQYREDAEKVLGVLRKRFEKYGLTFHPDKTRLIEFGRAALAKWEAKAGPKPGTFDFLGFTHICRRSRRGHFTIHVRTMRKRLRRSLSRVSAWCQCHRHRCAQGAVEDPQRDTPRPLPVLRAPDELPGAVGVLSWRPEGLAQVAQSAYARSVAPLARLRSTSRGVPAAAAVYCSALG
jgi:RNA-directed DNA polymerase